MNRASSPPNASRLTIVNHCRVAALSPSTRRLTDATVRLLVLVRKSDDVTRKYVHRARARVFARTPSRSRSRSSTFALDSACAVCITHSRKEKKVGTFRDDSNGRFERERVDASRSVRCGRRREPTSASTSTSGRRGRRGRRGRSRIETREGAPRFRREWSVGHSFGWRGRETKNESRQTRDDGWMTRTLGDVVRSSPSPGDGNVSLSRPRSRASSVRRRRRDSRRRDDRQRMYRAGYTPCNASHNSWLFAHGYIRES